MPPPQVYVPPPSGHIQNFFYSPNRATFKVGETVQFGWNALDVDQCRADLATSGTTLDAEWKTYYDSQSYTFDRAGTYAFYLSCSPALVETQVITLTAYWDDAPTSIDPRVGTAPSGGGGGGLGAGLMLALGLLAAGRRVARQHRRP